MSADQYASSPDTPARRRMSAARRDACFLSAPGRTMSPVCRRGNVLTILPSQDALDDGRIDPRRERV